MTTEERMLNVHNVASEIESLVTIASLIRYKKN